MEYPHLFGAFLSFFWFISCSKDSKWKSRSNLPRFISIHLWWGVGPCSRTLICWNPSTPEIRMRLHVENSPSGAYFFRPIPKNFPLKHYDWNSQDERFGMTWWTTGLINVTFWEGETARPISSPPPRCFTVAQEIPKLRVAEKDCWCQENMDSLPSSFFSNFIGLHQQGLVSFWFDCYPMYLSIKKMEICKRSETGHTPWLAKIAFKKTRREKKNNTPPDKNLEIIEKSTRNAIIV